MGIKLRLLLGCSGLIRYAVLIFILAVCAGTTWAVGVIGGGGITPWGGLQVKIDAPDNIKSAVQWNIGGYQNGQFFSWFNNGDIASAPAGSYFITFRPIAGWATPASQWVEVPADSTNNFFGSCSFVSLSGHYDGLFAEASGPRYESCGFCQVSGERSLSFTAQISSEGHRYSISGKFDKSGNAWSTIRRLGASPLSVHLLAGDDILSGEISNETWTATIFANRNTFDSRTQPASQAGRYTLAFPGSTNSAAQPGGDSFGTMSVNRSGGIALVVTFSDGTKASQSTFLGKDGRWPFYVPLYSGKGFAFGWLQLQSQSEIDPPKVELHRECNYCRWYIVLTPGDYDFFRLLQMADFQYDNGPGWSVDVPNGWTVTLYTNGYFGGAGVTKTNDDGCLVDDGIDLLLSTRVRANEVEVLPDFGNVTWIKPPQPRAKFYPAGFTNQMQTFVSNYQSTNRNSVLDSRNGKIVLQNGDLSQIITNGFSVGAGGAISGTNKLNLTMATSSGSFKGNLMNPVTRKVISFSGVVLQKQYFGRGFFLDGDQSGSVYLGP